MSAAGDISPRLKGKKSLPIDISYPLGGLENTNNSNWIIKPAETKSITTAAFASGYAASNIAIGYGAYASMQTNEIDGSIAIGSNAVSTYSGAIRIGNAPNNNDTTQIQGAKGANSIAIGQSTRSSGGHAIAIGTSAIGGAVGAIAIGQSANPSGSYSIGLGGGVTVTGNYSLAIGYGSLIECSAVANNSVAIGIAAKTEFNGEFTYGTGAFSLAGDAKSSWFGLLTTTTSATSLELGTGSSATAVHTNRLVLSNDSTYMFDVDIVARNTATDTESAAWNLKFAIRRGTNAASTTLIGTPVKTIFGQDTGTTTWDISVVADTTNGRPNISVTGEAAKTIRWVGNARMTKVTG
jgi:hypothetical protein